MTSKLKLKKSKTEVKVLVPQLIIEKLGKTCVKKIKRSPVDCSVRRSGVQGHHPLR